MENQNKSVQKKRIRKTGPNEKIPVNDGSFSVFKPILIGVIFTIIFTFVLFKGWMDPVLKTFLEKKSVEITSSTPVIKATTVVGASATTGLPPKITLPPKLASKNVKKENEPGYKVSGGKTAAGTSGWIKEIVTPGDGKTFPKKGDVVTIHYVGKLTDGKVFDSSRKRGQPFRTVIGVGRVIKGWDEGVLTMSTGESAILRIHSEYGYGTRGAGASIPPNSDLIFEVELLEITPKN